MAFRYLRARRQEGFISVIAWFSLLGIALGVSTLIIVMSVMNGFRHELLTRILGLNGHITVTGSQGYLNSYKPIAKKLREVNNIISVSPMIEGQVMVTAKGASQGAMVRGLYPEDLFARNILSSNIQIGSIKNFGSNNGILVGQRLAQKLGVSIGDQITLISPHGSVTAFGTVPRIKSYTIEAMFEIGMYEYDSNFIFMPMSAAKTYFKMKKAVSNLEIFLNNPSEAQYMKREIGQVLLNSKIYNL